MPNQINRSGILKDVNAAKRPAKQIRKMIFIIIGCVAVIGVLAYYFQDFLILKYYNYKTNSFKTNDKLYAPGYIVNEKSKHGPYNFDLYRLVEPKKKDLAHQSFLLRSNWVISSDSLRKYKTAYIGSYQGVEILSEFHGGKYFPSNFFAVKPNNKALVKQDITIYDVPDGYVWADGPFYVSAFNVEDKELTIFK